MIRSDWNGSSSSLVTPPRHATGRAPLGPRSHRALQRDRADIRRCGDAVRADLGTAPECILDFALDISGPRARLQHDEVAYALHALDAAHGSRGAIALVGPSGNGEHPAP